MPYTTWQFSVNGVMRYGMTTDYGDFVVMTFYETETQ